MDIRYIGCLLVLYGFMLVAKPSPDYAVLALGIFLHGVMTCGKEES
jgi:hypothetical protein